MSRVQALSRSRRPATSRRGKWDATAVAGAVMFTVLVLAAVLAPVIAPYGPTAQSPARLASPSPEHLLGTDAFGRDVLTRIIFGSRGSLTTSLAAIAIA